MDAQAVDVDRQSHICVTHSSGTRSFQETPHDLRITQQLIFCFTSDRNVGRPIPFENVVSFGDQRFQGGAGFDSFTSTLFTARASLFTSFGVVSITERRSDGPILI